VLPTALLMLIVPLGRHSGGGWGSQFSYTLEILKDWRALRRPPILRAPPPNGVRCGGRRRCLQIVNFVASRSSYRGGIYLQANCSVRSRSILTRQAGAACLRVGKSGGARTFGLPLPQAKLSAAMLGW
jgi:hypothetical protein